MALSVVGALRRGARQTASRKGLILAGILLGYIALLAVYGTVSALLLRPGVAAVAAGNVTVVAAAQLGGAVLGAVVLLALLPLIRVGMLRALIETGGFSRTTFTRSVGRPSLRYLGARLLQTAVVSVGFALLVVPGIYLALAFRFVRHRIAAADDTLLDAFRTSWRMTNGVKLRLLGLGIVMGVILMALPAIGGAVVAVFSEAVIGSLLVLLGSPSLSLVAPAAAAGLLVAAVTAVLGVFWTAVYADAYRQLRPEETGGGPDTGEVEQGRPAMEEAEGDAAEAPDEPDAGEEPAVEEDGAASEEAEEGPVEEREEEGFMAMVSAYVEQLQDLFTAEEEADGEDEGRFRIESISPNLVVIPAQEDVSQTDVRYPLIEPFTDAHVYWDDELETLVYEIDEPTLDATEQQMFDDLREAMEEKIDVPLSELESTDEIVNYLESKLDEVLAELGYQVSEESRQKLMYYIYRNFAGLNEIEPLMHDPYIEDIGCSGVDIPVYVVHSKFGSIRTGMVFDDEEELRNLVVKLAERANKYVSYAEPLLDGTLPDGSRVNASLTQDVTTKGPTFSIRKFQEVPYSAVDLIDLGTVDYTIMAYMWMVLEHHHSMLIIGGTATGKTTFLNSIVTFIPPEQKIVSIEDTRELQLPHENWIPSVTRTGVGLESEDVDISMYQLLRESFRQNPDYVIVGEVRGEEASVLFQGMASGHPSISTMHASSPHDVISRLTTPPINLSPALVETLDLIVSMTHAQQYGKNARRVDTVYEIEDITEGGSARTNKYIEWVPIDDTFARKAESTVLDNIQQAFGLTKEEVEDEIEDRKQVLEWLHDNGFTNFNEVARVVSEYYKNKDRVMDALSQQTDTRIGEIVEASERAPAPGEQEEELEEAAEAEHEELFADTEEGENPFED